MTNSRKKKYRKIIIGLTGQIAAGKDVVARILEKCGAYVIDADKIGHQVIEPQKKAWRGIIKTFGSKVLNKGGVINRKKLAKIVFANMESLKKLDSITHPEILRVIRDMIKRSKAPVVVVNAAILNELKLSSRVDKIIVVLADKKTRLRRLLRIGKSRRDMLARMRSQASEAKYRRLGDIVITNNGTIHQLCVKVMRAIKQI